MLLSASNRGYNISDTNVTTKNSQVFQEVKVQVYYTQNFRYGILVMNISVGLDERRNTADSSYNWMKICYIFIYVTGRMLFSSVV
jgi:hypothetical protein